MQFGLIIAFAKKIKKFISMNVSKNPVYQRIIIFLLIFFSLFTYKCAKVGTITGGPKDVTPPYMVSSKPEIYATNFKGDKIKIDFNEFVQLKDVSQQFNVSPPFKKKPKLWVNNKSVIVQYTDTLFDSTTYTFNFGKAIADNNEGNVIENFEFVFSTTSYLDSMGVHGKIVDALTLKASKDPLLAVLYSNLADSAPIKEKPLFTARTDKYGHFSINNVKPGKYRLYAFKDDNFNYKYDVAQEKFAFADTIVVLNPNTISQLIKPEMPDTSIKDSVILTHKQTVAELKQQRNSVLIDLKSFTEKNRQQIVKTYLWNDKHYLLLTFNNRLKNDSLELKPIYIPNKNWYQKEYLRDHDSILIWIADTSLLRTDTLRTAVSFWGTNKKNDTVWTADTLNFRYVAPNEKETAKNKALENKNGMKIICTENSITLNSEPVVETEYPVSLPDTSMCLFIRIADTLKIREKLNIIPDSIGLRRFRIKHKWLEDTEYRLTFFPGAFTNIYDIPNDTVKLTFRTRKDDAFGKLIIHMGNITEPTIIQLLSKDNVMYEKYITSNGDVIFDYIDPKEYNLRAIIDTNHDKKWTTGYFLKKIQPERVIYFKEAKNIRANWDVDMVWDLE